MSTSQRSAISSVVASASGMSANASAISSELLRKKSFVYDIFGAASVLLVCTQSRAACVGWSSLRR
jgi:hypothetical protein